LTVCIKILMAPLTHKSYVSSRKMQALQPKMAAIKARWRSKLKDKKGRPNMEAQKKQNEELQALMREEGVNPLGGCLPILLQMPFFFSFFALLRNSVDLWNAPWAFWIHDLSLKDPYFVLPVIMGASQFLQQRLIGSTSMEPSQRMMMNIMPIMFMFFFMQAPSGLVLYWVTSNLLTIAQQGVYQRLRSKGILGGGKSS
jgi:YidC/Oxa1 family membrane protein insertase